MFGLCPKVWIIITVKCYGTVHSRELVNKQSVHKLQRHSMSTWCAKVRCQLKPTWFCKMVIYGNIVSLLSEFSLGKFDVPAPRVMHFSALVRNVVDLCIACCYRPFCIFQTVNIVWPCNKRLLPLLFSQFIQLGWRSKAGQRVVPSCWRSCSIHCIHRWDWCNRDQKVCTPMF